jgi:hypothetical protein
MRSPVLLLAAPVLLWLIPAQGAVATPVCAGAAPIWEFSLSVQPTADRPPIAVREVHGLGAGYRLIYRPGQLPANVNKNAEVAIVLVPVNRGGEKKADVTVLDPQSALESAEWESPVSVDVAALVYGPQGLDKSRVRRLVQKDSELITQLADYAEKTALAESLIEHLRSSSANLAGPSTSLDAAVKGISAAPGAPTALDRTAPTDQQLNAMLRGLNPAIAGYDPLATTQSARIAQTAGVAARVAGLFFNNTVGLAVGSAALAENMRALLFPNMDFRSTFAQSSPNGSQTLCAKREAQQARTKLAYLWAVRVPNTPEPSLRIRAAAYLPQGGSGTIPAETLKETSWTSVGSVKQWRLTPASGSAGIAVAVTVEPKSQALKFDLAKAAVPVGEYVLNGAWDWSDFAAAGPIHVVTPPDLSKAAIEPASSDRLVHGGSAVDIRLSGADFEFVDTVKLQPEKPDAKPLELTPKLPLGLGAGPQETVTLNVNPGTLAIGRYKLSLSEPGGKTIEIPLRILPPVPMLTGLPVRVNLGETSQTVTLKGTGLERIEGLSSGSAQIELAAAGVEDSERRATVHLGSGLHAHQELDLQMKVEGMTGLQSLKLALKVAPARPKITAASMSRAQSLGIELKPDELPADTFVTYSVRVEHLEGPATVRIACLESTQTLAAQELRPGEKSSAARLDRSGAGGLFLSLMPGAIGQPGCELSASVETAEAGSSDGWKLGRVARLPKIERFTVTDEKLSDALYAGVLEGEHLESIGKVGWDADHGLPIDSLPVPMAGDSQRQTLRIPIAWPSPSPRAALYVWLQGEDKGRLTASRY